MNGPFNVFVAATVVAGTLAGCASTRPSAPAASTAAPAPASVAASDAASVPASAPAAALAPTAATSLATVKPIEAVAADAGFRQATRKGQQVYCKRELMTGSRTKTTETCFTTAQLERQRNNVQDLMRDVSEMSDGGRPGNTADGSGGRYNNAMTQ